MSDRTFRFGAFEVDEGSGKLRKHGVKIRVQEQPFQILILLLERPNEIVGREEIRARLWPENTFVDFDNAISSAVRKLREALNDSADNPHFIETVARRGYRFIGQIAMRSPVPAVQKRVGMKAIRVAVVALPILGLAGWWLLSRPKPNTTPLTPLPLTAAHGSESRPSFSPDGNQVAYGWRAAETGNGNSHIYVKLVGAGVPMQLTANSKPDTYPAWSPDGRHIAFIRLSDSIPVVPPVIRHQPPPRPVLPVPEPSTILSLPLGYDARPAYGGTIYLIPPVGGSERRVTDGYFYGPAYWSPDSRFLVVGDRMSQNGISSIYLLNVENGERLRLTTPPDAKTMDQGAIFSPDGKTLLFTRCSEVSTCALYLLDLSIGYRPRGAPRLLREETGDIRGVAWTAGGKEIVYVLANYGWGNYHLMRIPVRSRALPERLWYAGEQLGMGVAIAPRENRLGYVKNLYDSDIWRIQGQTPPQTFIGSTRLELSPEYSPDGKRVAFCSDRSGQMEIWVSDAEGGNLEQLTNSEFSGSARWSPDGRSLAFDRHLKQGWHVFVMASDGGQVRQLTAESGNEVVPNWSRNGNWIYYASDRTGRYEIWKAPANGGKSTQVTHKGGWLASESFDGGTLYYSKNLDSSDHVSDLWALPVGGGEERMVLRSILGRGFIVVKDGIYYVPALAVNGRASIRFHDFTTGKSHEIVSIKDLAGGFTISPDRTTFLFSVTRRSEANVMIVDNFR